jgi:hypothetical protein
LLVDSNIIIENDYIIDDVEQTNLNKIPVSPIDIPVPESPELTEEEKERSDLMKEWEEKMGDFNPAEMMTFEINARSHIEFFEDIHEEGS